MPCTIVSIQLVGLYLEMQARDMLSVDQRLSRKTYNTYPSIKEQEETAKDLQPCSQSPVRWRATRWSTRRLLLLWNVCFCICGLLERLGVGHVRRRHVVRRLGVWGRWYGRFLLLLVTGLGGHDDVQASAKGD
jgi:hypothetical protein